MRDVAVKLNKKIESFRSKLEAKAAGGSLQDRSVLRESQKLDQLINDYYQESEKNQGEKQ